MTWDSLPLAKAKLDIWILPNGDVYEYIGVYVDDLAMTAPQEIINILQGKQGFKLKGTGPIHSILEWISSAIAMALFSVWLQRSTSKT